MSNKQQISQNEKRNYIVNFLKKQEKTLIEVETLGTIYFGIDINDSIRSITIGINICTSPYSAEADLIIEKCFQQVVDKVKIGKEEIFLLTKPVVGIGATTGYNGDYYPHTVHEVSEDLKTIYVSGDDYKVIGGPYPYGSDIPYSYSNNNSNDKKKWTKCTLRKNGYYITDGCSINNSWFNTMYLGYRKYAQNPEF